MKTSLVTMWELMKPSWCPHLNAGLIWDITADITLDLDGDASLLDLAMIHHLLAMRLTKVDGAIRGKSIEQLVEARHMLGST